MRLTETGLLRWYTTCCNTPIGNTLPIYKMSFIGLIHTCLESSEITLDNAFGATCVHVNTTYSQGEIKANPVDLIVTIIRNVTRVFRARIDGSYKQTPFFLADSGIPIVSPKILSHQEYEDIMSAV
ncbi:preprotein translocase subunit [Leptolyngbya sp. Heron Island J]|nr:preprotein translocase subunit [Leptolyngbya sp. Heron Island J]